MKRTLLSALKHGSGILLTIFALLCSCQGVWADDARGKTIYLNIVGDWASAAANYCLYYYDHETKANHDFVAMSTTSSSSVFYAVVPQETYVCDRLIFVRRDPTASSTCSWDNVWNQTVDLEYTNGYDYCTVGSSKNSDNPAKYYGSWSYLRNFSDGEYIYFVNGTNYDSDKGAVTSTWIYSNDSNEIGYADIILTDIYGSTHTYRFSYYSGTEYESGATYRALIDEDIICKSFVITRGNTIGETEWNRSRNDMTFDATHATYNTITNTSSGTSWTGSNTTYCNDPTVTAGEYSDLTSESVTIAATVTAAESDPCELSKVGVDVYTDQACTVSASVNKEVSYVGSDYSITEVNVSSLSPKVTYYYKTYAKRSSDNAKVYSSNVGSFTMPCQSGVETTDPSSAGEGPKCFGDSFTALSVTASGASGYTYQWYYNTTNSTTEGSIAISGATSASYTPAVVGENYYYCAVGATGGYCEENSHYSGKVIINAKPTLSVSESSVTNYAPVTVTAKGADIATWSVDTPANNSDCYLYKKTASSAKFKAKVKASATYTITGTTANSCSNTATVTVTTDSQNCE